MSQTRFITFALAIILAIFSITSFLIVCKHYVVCIDYVFQEAIHTFPPTPDIISQADYEQALLNSKIIGVTVILTSAFALAFSLTNIRPKNRPLKWVRISSVLICLVSLFLIFFNGYILYALLN